LSPEAGAADVLEGMEMVQAGAGPVVGGREDRVAVDALVAGLFREEVRSLVRLARFFVDDREAAEDLVQEAFIRLARSAYRIRERDKAAAYLRSIVLNLARDHNRRGLVSVRHRPAADPQPAGVEELAVVRAEQREVIEALRDLPRRQRDCVVLRYYLELGVPQIAATLGLSANSVKTHLQRGLRALEARLEVTAR
jgi:RNA polymerase sigma-70 factor (sigma-E family)